MQWRALLFPLLFHNFVFCENKTQNDSKTKKVLAVLGYLNGYDVDQNQEKPYFLLAPIILVPKVIDIKPDGETLNGKETLQNEGKKQVTKPLKIVNNPKVTENNDDIDVHFRQALNRGSMAKNDSIGIKLNETINPSDNATKNATVVDVVTTPKTVTTQAPKVNDTTNITTSTESIETNPIGMNGQSESLTLPIDSPDYFLLPPLIDQEWKNFTSINVSIENDNKTSTNSEQVEHSMVNETDSTIKGPYPAALYNNTEIDQLSITTNSYTNGSPLPPPQDDRWKSSSLDKMLPVLNEFRPLAGLYYDGFLHKPLYKKPGFVPYNRYYY
ncbi:unnamed protein product [Chrysodeixis includens]|uniref:Uncharacterized protein n=1 Tax=Chrysodeixis includens TaxID=689277 RepID=A0A9P0FQF2_CHRIL|nr:unnamed protein product [Chrysodeixis includens]